MNLSKLLFLLALLVISFTGSSKQSSEETSPSKKDNEEAEPSKKEREETTPLQKESADTELSQKVSEEAASPKKEIEGAAPSQIISEEEPEHEEEPELKSQKVSEEATSSRNISEEAASSKKDSDCTKVKATLKYLHQVIEGPEADENCSFEESHEILEAMTIPEFLQCLKTDEELFGIEEVDLEDEDADLMKESLLIRYSLMWRNESIFKDDFFQDPDWLKTLKKMVPSSNEISRLASNFTKLSQKHPKLIENGIRISKKTNPKAIQFAQVRMQKFMMQAVKEASEKPELAREFQEVMDDFMQKQKAMNAAGLAMGNF